MKVTKSFYINLAAVALLLSLRTVPGTSSYYHDDEKSRNNKLAAQTLDLILDGDFTHSDDDSDACERESDDKHDKYSYKDDSNDEVNETTESTSSERNRHKEEKDERDDDDKDEKCEDEHNDKKYDYHYKKNAKPGYHSWNKKNEERSRKHKNNDENNEDAYHSQNSTKTVNLTVKNTGGLPFIYNLNITSIDPEVPCDDVNLKVFMKKSNAQILKYDNTLTKFWLNIDEPDVDMQLDPGKSHHYIFEVSHGGKCEFEVTSQARLKDLLFGESYSDEEVIQF